MTNGFRDDVFLCCSNGCGAGRGVPIYWANSMINTEGKLFLRVLPPRLVVEHLVVALVTVFEWQSRAAAVFVRVEFAVSPESALAT